MAKDAEPQNPQPTPPTGSGGGSDPAPEPITIPPKWGTYSEPDIGTSINVPFDFEIKTGKE